jgi:hypothetical protein
MNKRGRDILESVLFDALLIITGIFTLPFTQSVSSKVADGWVAALIQSLMLFTFRSSARYLFRRWFRVTEL